MYHADTKREEFEGFLSTLRSSEGDFPKGTRRKNDVCYKKIMTNF